MTDELMSAICLNITKHEGRKLMMYLDTKGIVTCGIGHALFRCDDAHLIQWLKHGDKPASRAEVIAAWTAVKLSKRQDPELYMTFEEMERVLALDMPRFVVEVKREFSESDEYPSPAMVAIHDICFTCGSLTGWPRLTAAIKVGDWKTAANESYRPDVGSERNKDTANQFMSCAA